MRLEAEQVREEDDTETEKDSAKFKTYAQVHPGDKSPGVMHALQKAAEEAKASNDGAKRQQMMEQLKQVIKVLGMVQL